MFYFIFYHTLIYIVSFLSIENVTRHDFLTMESSLGRSSHHVSSRFPLRLRNPYFLHCFLLVLPGYFYNLFRGQINLNKWPANHRNHLSLVCKRGNDLPQNESFTIQQQNHLLDFNNWSGNFCLHHLLFKGFLFVHSHLWNRFRYFDWVRVCGSIKKLLWTHSW